MFEGVGWAYFLVAGLLISFGYLAQERVCSLLRFLCVVVFFFGFDPRLPYHLGKGGWLFFVYSEFGGVSVVVAALD